MKYSDDVKTIKGVGEKTAQLFKKLGITTIGGLLEFYPREYTMFELPTDIEKVCDGGIFAIEGSIVSEPSLSRKGSRTTVTVTVKDPTGFIKLYWFNQPYIARMLHPGYRMIFRGRVLVRGTVKALDQPKIYKKEEYARLCGVLMPIYPLTGGLTNNAVSKAVKAALSEIDEITDFVPRRLSRECGLMKRKEAISNIHFPMDIEGMQAARNRLAFDEFFIFMSVMKRAREESKKAENRYIIPWCDDCERLERSLPYELTGAQKRALSDIRRDLGGSSPACRLIQGDVGSGKTILAVFMLLMTAKAGYQGVIMAPTEVLANQHYRSISALLSPFGVNVLLLTGSLTAKQKREAYTEIESGTAQVIVGTHALIEDAVKYKNNALVITDEQHRFGVKQRAKLAEKGTDVHIFYMTATPIPRTLAILLYGDLEISVLDEMPKNRLAIKNCVVGTSYRETAYGFIGREVAAGRQAYIICPMVEASENVDAENVNDYTENLKVRLKDVRIEMLHGKMKPSKKNEIMERFARGETDVLVSTTVIEVGINVANATVMMIENAERFGLAQLHQLRGRVGRGKHQSYCIFMSGNPSGDNMERLDIMQKTNDGFRIAEEDMKHRGPGDMLGVRQSGDFEFSVADIYRDAKILALAKDAVGRLTEDERSELCGMIDSQNMAENLKY